LRVLVDHRGNDVGKTIPPELLTRVLKNSKPYTLLDKSEDREELLPGLILKAGSNAGDQVPGIVAQARKEMTEQLDHEITRLRDLQKVNRSVRAEEIDLLIQQRDELDQRLVGARLRLDAIRLIQRGTH
jgi:ATP-dependent helicase HepA